MRLPFSWGGVRLGGVGASRLRVGIARIEARDGLARELSLVAVDDAGGLVVSVGRWWRGRSRRSSSGRVRMDMQESLFSVDWVPVQGRNGTAVVADADGVWMDVRSLDVRRWQTGEELPEVVVWMRGEEEADRASEEGLPGQARDVVQGVGCVAGVACRRAVRRVGGWWW